jgi:hypothetical protein
MKKHLRVVRDALMSCGKFFVTAFLRALVREVIAIILSN